LHFFQQLKKELKIKYETLRKSQLENIRDNGCRVLVLSCSIPQNDHSNICIEGELGEVERISLQELEDFLRPE